MTGAETPTEDRSRTRSIFSAAHLAPIGLILAFVGAMAAVLVARPSNLAPSSQHQMDALHTAEQNSAAIMLLTVDSLDANQGLLHTRVQAIAGSKLPASGVTFVTSVGAIPTITLRPGGIDREISASVPVTAGNVTNYPFDGYRLSVTVVAYAGTVVRSLIGTHPVTVPVTVIGRNNSAGIEVSGVRTHAPGGVQTLDVNIQRSASTRWWVVAMMAMFWAISLGAAAVAILVLLGQRPWETRLLAWLAAILFALITLRAAAPGEPPIGTYFDYYAVFEAVSIVALSLIVLTGYYAAASRRRLDV